MEGNRANGLMTYRLGEKPTTRKISLSLIPLWFAGFVTRSHPSPRRETAREPPSHQEQAHSNEDQHDGQYRLEGFAGNVRREPAPDQDAGNAAEEQGPCQAEVHVALRQVGYAHHKREEHGVGDVCADDDGRRYGVEKEQQDDHDASRADGGEPDQVATECTEQDGEDPALRAHAALSVPHPRPGGSGPLGHEILAEDQGSPYHN